MTDTYDPLDPKELARFAYCDLRKSYEERVSRWRPEALLTAPHTPEEETEALLHEFMYHIRMVEKIVDVARNMMAEGQPLRCALCHGLPSSQLPPSPAVIKRTQEALDAVRRVMAISRFVQRVLRRLLDSWAKLNRSEAALLEDDPEVPAS